MLALLPAASLTACLAWSVRSLYAKLRRKGVRWVYGRTEPPARQEDVAAVHAAHDGGQHRVDGNGEGGAGGWEEDSERDQGRRCARFLTQEKRVQGRGKCSQMCQQALTRKRTLWGGGAPEVGDFRLVEDGSQRSGGLSSDVVGSETVSEGWRGGAVREQACQ